MGTVTDSVRTGLLESYDEIEAHLLATIADPGPVVAGEDIARDPEGNPVPNEQVRAEAKRLLARLQRDRDKIT